MSAIRIGLDNLFKASIFIRNCASRDRRLRAAETEPFDNRADMMHIKDRYPILKDNSALVLRLGEANARRRQHFKYRSEHDERLSTVPTRDDSDNVKAQVHPGVVRAETAKTELTGETKPSLLADTAATTFVADEAAQARMFALPAAQDVKPAVSLATFVAETSDEDLPFPPVPAEDLKNPSFKCPYCCLWLELKLESLETQWRYEEINLLPGSIDFSQAACPSRSRALHLHFLILQP